MKRGLLIVVGICSLALLLGSAVPTHAAASFCRTDPTVTLSDGTQIVMAAQITGSITNVQKVAYTLHIPTPNGNNAAPTVTGIVYDQYGNLESVNVVADQTGKHYEIDTVVSDSQRYTSVTASASLNGSDTQSASGSAGSNPLVITFTHG